MYLMDNKPAETALLAALRKESNIFMCDDYKTSKRLGSLNRTHNGEESERWAVAL